MSNRKHTPKRQPNTNTQSRLSGSTAEQTPKRLTFAAVKAELATLGVRITPPHDGDYRVTLQGGSEASAYYTDDLADALGTGRKMKEQGATVRALQDYSATCEGCGATQVTVTDQGLCLRCTSKSERLESPCAGCDNSPQTCTCGPVDDGAASDLATVLAALRLFQETYEEADADAIREDWEEHFTRADGSKIAPLGSDDINNLSERINCGHWPDPNADISLRHQQTKQPLAALTEIVEHDGKPAHTNFAVLGPSHQTPLNYCSRCNGWFYPVAAQQRLQEAQESKTWTPPCGN